MRKPCKNNSKQQTVRAVPRAKNGYGNCQDVLLPAATTWPRTPSCPQVCCPIASRNDASEATRGSAHTLGGHGQCLPGRPWCFRAARDQHGDLTHGLLGSVITCCDDALQKTNAGVRAAPQVSEESHSSPQVSITLRHSVTVQNSDWQGYFRSLRQSPSSTKNKRECRTVWFTLFFSACCARVHECLFSSLTSEQTRSKMAHRAFASKGEAAWPCRVCRYQQHGAPSSAPARSRSPFLEAPASPMFSSLQVRRTGELHHDQVSG